MTYQVSSNKLFISELKQRLWALIVMFIAFLIIEPITLLMTIDGFEVNGNVAITENLYDYFRYSFAYDGRWAIIAGAVMAFICFGYLYSKSAVDLFHSLPIKRERLYIYKIIIGVGFGELILITCSAMSFAVVIAKGYLVGPVGNALLLTSVKGMLGYLFIFAVCTIGIMLTGTVVMGILGSVVLLSVSSVIEWVKTSYMSLCFSTYCSTEDQITLLKLLLNPFKIYNVTIKQKDLYFMFFVLFVELIILLLIGMNLFLKRPMECVSTAISFKALKPFIRVPLVILAALIGGAYVSFTVSALAEVWYWTAFFGLGILAHVILEWIFEQEIKGIVRHPIEFVACMAVAAIISFSLLYDWFGYDTYIPKKDKIVSAAVRLSSIENNTAHYARNEFGYWDYESEDNFFEEVICDTDAVIDIAGIGVASLDRSGSAINRMVTEMNNDYNRYKTANMFTVCYHLTSGRVVYRNYMPDIMDSYDETARIYEEESYKDYIYDFSSEVESILEKSITCYDALQGEVFRGSNIDGRKFLDAYLADLHDRKFDDLSAYPIFTLSGYDPETGMDFLGMHAIYETDRRSIEFIRSCGINIDEYKNMLTPDKINKITIYDYNNEKFTYDAGYGNEPVGEYTNPDDLDKITELSGKIIPSNVGYTNSILHPLEDNLEIRVDYVSSDGYSKEVYCVVPEGTVVY